MAKRGWFVLHKCLGLWIGQNADTIVISDLEGTVAFAHIEDGKLIVDSCTCGTE